jgi:pilus assembly protein CpaF
MALLLGCASVAARVFMQAICRARPALWRLETMALMSDVDLPVAHVRAQVLSAIDLVVHTARLRDQTDRCSRSQASVRLCARAYPRELP